MRLVPRNIRSSLRVWSGKVSQKMWFFISDLKDEQENLKIWKCGWGNCKLKERHKQTYRHRKIPDIFWKRYIVHKGWNIRLVIEMKWKRIILFYIYKGLTVSDIIVNILETLTHLIFMITSWHCYYYYYCSHFKDEENWNTESFSNLARVTQLVSSRDRHSVCRICAL